jgi:hypothetical protein
VYLFRYAPDTPPTAPGGFNDRSYVVKRTIGGAFFLLLNKNEDAIKIMMEDGDDNPARIKEKMQRM